MPEKKKKKSKHIHVKDVYFADMGGKMKKGFGRSLIRKIFHRPVFKREIHHKTFSADFSATKLRWYSNLLNMFYLKLDGAASCFFTDEGTLVIIFMVWGDPDAEEFFEMPQMKDEFVEDREATQKKKKKSLKVDKDSVKEEVKDDGYHLQYEETYKDHGKEVKMFEHIIYSGIDKLVFRAIVPPKVLPETLDDILAIAKSLRIKVTQ
ncbi:MAG: hypothetical protein PHV93_02835 [Candidatus Pacebacteria bacterium]|nr:hypothetical protein [Candidatus Paceibacterota bacterium]